MSEVTTTVRKGAVALTVAGLLGTAWTASAVEGPGRPSTVQDSPSGGTASAWSASRSPAAASTEATAAASTGTRPEVEPPTTAVPSGSR